MARINDEKEHYRSLISLFKFAIGIFSAFAFVVGFIVYSDGQDMRQELNNRRDFIEKKSTEMSDKFETQQKEHLAELKEQRTEMQIDRDKLIKNFHEEINLTKAQALYEIANVKMTSKEIAEFEAKKKINEVFEGKNFDEFVEKEAEKRIAPKINSIVDDRIAKSINDQVQIAINEILSGEILKISQGTSFFQSNLNIKISDEQLKLLYEYIPKMQMPFQYTLTKSIINRENNIATTYNKNWINSNDVNLNDYAYEYFIVHKIEYKEVENFIYKEIINTDATGNRLSGLLSYYSHNKKDFAVNLMNSKNIVDALFQKNTDKEYLARFIGNNKVELLKYFTNEELNSFYLFQKKIQ